jgi:TetR/AcrR family acrAB operon transcriptional repressor
MRRTKEDAEHTKKRILDAARAVFARRGAARTSLERIARAAGVTRGAIYWHFANKTELFFAMREEVSLPIIDHIESALSRGNESDPLSGIERFMKGIIETLESDRCARETFQILAFKCEYVAELRKELEGQVASFGELAELLKRAYRNAKRAGQLRAELRPALAAAESCVFLVGLIRLWLVDDSGEFIRHRAKKLVAAHVRSRRAERAAGTARTSER